MNRLLALAALAALVSAPQPASRPRPTVEWIPIKAPAGGHVEGVVPHEDLLFARADSAWWMSADRGASWQLAPGRFRTTSWIEPIGADVFVLDPRGIARTPDRGRSWISCGPLPRTERGDTRLAAAGRSLLYWLPQTGLFRSDDRCATWTRVQTPWNVNATVGFVLAPDVDLVFIHASENWFRSTDYGQSWTSVSGPPASSLPAASNGRSAIVFGTDLVVGTTKGVFRSVDRGVSWSPIGFRGRWARTTVTDRGVIYAALDQGQSARVRTRVVRSTDRGATWAPADDGLSGHYVHDLRRDASGAVYASSDAGVYRLESSGRWQALGLPPLIPTFLFAAPWGDLYLGTDYTNAYRSQDGGVTWRPLLPPNQLARCIAATTRGELLLGTDDGIVRSRDRGDTWEQLDMHEDVRTIFTVPSTGGIVAGTTKSVFRSDDNGATWVERGPGAADVFPVSFAAATNGEVFVGSGDGEVYRLPDGSEPWHQLPSMHDGSEVAGLAVLANGDVLAGTTFALSRWKRRDDTWEELALSSEEKPRVRSVMLDPSGRLVAATAAAGVLISSDQGRTWIPANRGLPTRRIHRMAVGPAGEVYIAAGTDRLSIYRGRLADK